MARALRPQYPCLRCISHKAVFQGYGLDDDGQRIPIYSHYCGEKSLRDVELEFGCGLYREAYQ